jgi:hypothetical protein
MIRDSVQEVPFPKFLIKGASLANQARGKSEYLPLQTHPAYSLKEISNNQEGTGT